MKILIFTLIASTQVAITQVASGQTQALFQESAGFSAIDKSNFGIIEKYLSIVKYDIFILENSCFSYRNIGESGNYSGESVTICDTNNPLVKQLIMNNGELKSFDSTYVRNIYHHKQQIYPIEKKTITKPIVIHKKQPKRGKHKQNNLGLLFILIFIGGIFGTLQIWLSKEVN